MYKGQELIIITNSRGEIRGVPSGVDDFNTDPDKLGYYVRISQYEEDTVFLDEVTAISEIKPIRISSSLTTEAV